MRIGYTRLLFFTVNAYCNNSQYEQVIWFHDPILRNSASTPTTMWTCDISRDGQCVVLRTEHHVSRAYRKFSQSY